MIRTDQNPSSTPHMRKIHRFRPLLLSLLLALPAGLAPAQTAMPDPLTGVTDHYWTDPDRPAQTELRDCHLFEVLGWGRGLDEIRSRMRMACHHLARMGPGGSDANRATVTALLAFEAESRAQMVNIDRSMRAGAAPDAAPPSGSLVIRTGWWADAYMQDRLIETHALDLIMGEIFETGR